MRTSNESYLRPQSSERQQSPQNSDCQRESLLNDQILLSKFKKEWQTAKATILKMEENKKSDGPKRVSFYQFSKFMMCFKFLKTKKQLQDLDRAYIKRDVSK